MPLARRAAAVLTTALAAGLAGLAPANAAPANAAPANAAPAPAAAAPVSVATGLPTADTVGVPAGTSLTAMAGGIVETSNATISNRVITGDVRFTGSNLTLRNVKVTGHAVFRGDTIVLEDSEVGALSLSGTTGVTVSGVDVTGSAGDDGIHITSGSGPAGRIVIQDTWVHNPIVTPTSHYDGIQVRGVDGLTLDRVLVDLGAYRPQYNAALFIERMPEANRNVTVKDSSFLGGGYVMYNFAANISVTGTTFGKASFGNLYPKSWSFATFANNTSPTGYVLAYTAGDIVPTSQLATAPPATPAPAPSPTPSPAPSPTPPPAPSPAPSPTPSPAPSPAPSPGTATTPSASTTGTVEGAELTPMTGGYIRTDDATITDKVIEGDATFVGDDLTLRNVRVTGTVIFRGDRVDVEDSEFGAVVLSGTAGATLTRVDVFGRSGRDGIQITAGSGPVSDVVIADSWIHDPVVTPGMSYQGIQVRGVDGLTIDNVLVDLGAFAPELDAALRLHDNNGGSRDVTVTGSRLLGGEHVLGTDGTAVRITDSVLGDGQDAYLDPDSAPLTTFTGNCSPTGAALRYTGSAITD